MWFLDLFVYKDSGTGQQNQNPTKPKSALKKTNPRGGQNNIIHVWAPKMAPGKPFHQQKKNESGSKEPFDHG